MAEKKVDDVIAAQNNAMAESVVEGKVSDTTEDIVHAAESEFTPEQYRKLLWKIDLIILPLMWVGRHLDPGGPGGEVAVHTDEAEADLFGRAICGQELDINASHFWPRGRYSPGWTAILMLVCA